jgi:hypothetical protein
MSYRFLDGQPVKHGPMPGAESAKREFVRVTILPRDAIICDGCGYVMWADPYVKGTDGTHFQCGYRGCEQYNKRIFITYQRLSIQVAEPREP